MKNPNEYNDEAWTAARSKLTTALGSMWEAGASADDIETALADGFDNLGIDADFTFTLTESVPDTSERRPKPKR